MCWGVGSARPPPTPSAAGGAPATGIDHEYISVFIPSGVTSRSLLGGIFGSTIPCNSVYNFNHYLCLSIKIYHMAEYFSLVRLQQNISAGASQQNISAGASAAD